VSAEGGQSAGQARRSPGTQRGPLRTFQPRWYAAVMGTAIVGIVAYQNPGQVASPADAMQAFGVLRAVRSGAAWRR
jgi:hypothetical protein